MGPMSQWTRWVQQAQSAQKAQWVPGPNGPKWLQPGPMGQWSNGPKGPSGSQVQLGATAQWVTGPTGDQWVLGPTGPWAQLAPWRETEADVYVSRRYCCMRFQHAHCLHACSLSICIMASNPFRPLVSHSSHASPKL